MSGEMLWRDIEVGMLVEVHADDYWGGRSLSKREREMTEYPFTIIGEVVLHTQRKMVVRGLWIWHCDPSEFTNDDPRVSLDEFGVPRRGPDQIFELIRGRRWCPPIPD